MDIVTLFNLARVAGLTVKVKSSRLVVRGHKRAADLAQELIARKTEVLDALAKEWATAGAMQDDRPTEAFVMITEAKTDKFAGDFE